MSRTADRLNHDQFDLLCRAADIIGTATLAELAEVLDGANLLPRAKTAAHALILDGFMVRKGEMYEITAAGVAALG